MASAGFVATKNPVPPVPLPYLPTPQSVHASEPVTVLYLPITHASQNPPSGPVVPVLHRQLVRTIPPVVVELDSTGQATQAVSAVAPVVVRYLPTPQLVHAVEPVTALNLPAAHNTHVPPSGPVNPGLQRQLLTFPLPPIDTVFAGQGKQVALDEAPEVAEYEFAQQSGQPLLPTTLLYFPATHATHTPAMGPVNPMLHTQPVLPAFELEFIGHATQAEACTAPVVARNFPESHAVHGPP